MFGTKRNLNNIKNSLLLIDRFFKKNGIDYWLEAGTALSAYRDGKVFEWEHDVDVGIWREKMPNPDQFINFFSSKGYKVIIQKDFPFLDNIIQLKVDSEHNNDLFDVDIYLYTRMEGFAYMRWIQKPEGSYNSLKKRLIFILRNLYNPNTKKWVRISRLIPKKMIKFFFDKYLHFHLRTSTCIYHKFPEKYFLNLKKIDFYGISANIPEDINEFLIHRYGEHWRTPDSQFNQSGKWKKSRARVELEMSLLPSPEYYNQQR